MISLPPENTLYKNTTWKCILLSQLRRAGCSNLLRNALKVRYDCEENAPFEPWGANCKDLLEKIKKKQKKHVSNSTPKHTDLILAGSFNEKLERVGEKIISGNKYRFLHEGSGKGIDSEWKLIFRCETLF